MARLSIHSAVSLLSGLLFLFSGSYGGAETTNGTYPQFPVYRQELTIEFTDEDSAKQATFAIEPLFDGHYRAVSCRWDDNWTSDNEKTRDVMEECGIQGTWYLNGRSFSPEGKPADYAPIARKLLQGGNSVGGHSMTHPYITYFHSNRMFAEMAGVRIDWEAALDKPVSSYAYSFVDLRPMPEGREVMLRTLDTLERSGLYHIATFNFFDDVDLRLEFSPIMPPENHPFDAFKEAVDWAYNDTGFSEKYPMISNSMHAWYDTMRSSYGYDELRKRFDLLNELEDIWHCNQNEYAAYRRQVRLAKLSTVERDGKLVTLSLVRPELIALNDTVPLTVSISGVAPSKVSAVGCTTADLKDSESTSTEKRMVHVGHDRTQSLPLKIGHVSNNENASELAAVAADSDFPRIVGLIKEEEGSLDLQIRNDSDTSIENVIVRWRVPIGWKLENQLEQALTCEPGQTVQLSQRLIPQGPEQRRFGTAHFAAQVDFSIDDQPGRIHFTCQKRSEAMPDDSYPLDHFALLGPFDKDKFDASGFTDRLLSKGCPEEWSTEDGTKLRWRPTARDGYITHSWLNPEYVRTMGTWDHISPTYVLRSRVVSEVDQDAEVVLSHDKLCKVFLNGKQPDSRRVTLRSGENELVIIYPGVLITHEAKRLAACFVRLADPESGKRLANIRYRPF